MNITRSRPFFRLWYVLFPGVVLLPGVLAAEPPVRFEIRHVSEQPQRGFMPMKVRGSDQVFHVSLDAQVTSRDVEKVSQGVGPGMTNVIEIHLRPRGAARMEALTSRNLGGRLAIVIDRELIFAPVIRATIRGRIQVDGLGEAEARRVYESLSSGRFVARQRLFPRRR